MILIVVIDLIINYIFAVLEDEILEFDDLKIEVEKRNMMERGNILKKSSFYKSFPKKYPVSIWLKADDLVKNCSKETNVAPKAETKIDDEIENLIDVLGSFDISDDTSNSTNEPTLTVPRKKNSPVEKFAFDFDMLDTEIKCLDSSPSGEKSPKVKTKQNDANTSTSPSSQSKSSVLKRLFSFKRSSTEVERIKTKAKLNRPPESSSPASSSSTTMEYEITGDNSSHVLNKSMETDRVINDRIGSDFEFLVKAYTFRTPNCLIDKLLKLVQVNLHTLLEASGDNEDLKKTGNGLKTMIITRQKKFKQFSDHLINTIGFSTSASQNKNDNNQPTSGKMNTSIEAQYNFDPNAYLLQICGFEQYLIGEQPLIRYEVIFYGF